MNKKTKNVQKKHHKRVQKIKAKIKARKTQASKEKAAGAQ
jgi:hypothetical protein